MTTERTHFCAKINPMPPTEELRAVFGYHRDGYLFRNKGANFATGPKPVGCTNSRGYRVLTYRGRRYFEHRLIWKMFHDREPMGEIDHSDQDKTNNKIENLRDCTGYENHLNRPPKPPGRGVSYMQKKGLWRAYGGRKGRGPWVSLGYFKTEAEAVAARAAYDAQ